MLIYPHMNPVAFQVGSLRVFWYGIMYLLSFLLGWILIAYRVKKTHSAWSSQQIADLIFYIAIGVVAGGRLGYMLFYDFSDFIHQPWIILKTWEGGMSFHGGLIGVILAITIFSKKHHRPWFSISDLIAPIVPIGLGAGRIGNFVNTELMGRITHIPWGMIYPGGGPFPRHPSPLYEFFFEGVVLFLILWFFSLKPRPRMAVSGLFLVNYGIFRCFCELFRQPDPQYGFIFSNWLTMGQLLSFPMIIIGIILFITAYVNPRQIDVTH